MFILPTPQVFVCSFPSSRRHDNSYVPAKLVHYFNQNLHSCDEGKAKKHFIPV